MSTSVDVVPRYILEIKPQDIKETGVVIGKGATGIVYEAIYCGKVCAKKEILEKLLDDETQINNFREEVKVIGQIGHHPNVVLFLGACLGKHPCLVTERCTMSLADFMKPPKYEEVTLHERFKKGHDILLGLAWLHEMGVVHADLKPDNILIDSNGVCKVGDFGFSRLHQNSHHLTQTSNAMGDPKGAPLYMGPERLKYISRQDYSAPAFKESDVYSFAILLWEILTGKAPFPYKTIVDLKENVVNNGVRPSKSDFVEKLGTEILSTGIWELLEDMWQTDFKKRPTFIKVLEKYEKVLIFNAIWDAKGRDFWRKNFCKNELATESVEWKHFVNALVSRFIALEEFPSEKDVSLATWALKAILGAGESDRVSMVKFGMVCDAFGPWEFSRKNGKWGGIIEKIQPLHEAIWFHPLLSKKGAFELLEHQKPGSFLVRFSSRKHCLVISKKDTDKVSETHILSNSNRYSVKKSIESFTTLKDLIENMQSLKVLKDPAAVKAPLPKSIQIDVTSKYEDESFAVELANVKTPKLKKKLESLQKEMDELKKRMEEGDFSVITRIGDLEVEMGKIRVFIEKKSCIVM